MCNVYSNIIYIYNFKVIYYYYLFYIFTTISKTIKILFNCKIKI